MEKSDQPLSRKFKGVWIPAEIYLCSELSWTEKILLVEIDSLSKNGESCYASNEYLGRFLRVKPDTVTKAITKLKRLGLVKLSGFDGRKRYLQTCYNSIHSLGEKSESDPEKNPRPYKSINKELLIKKRNINISSISDSHESLSEKEKDQHPVGFVETLSILKKPIRSSKNTRPKKIGFLSPKEKLRQRQLDQRPAPKPKKQIKEHITNGWKKLVLDSWNRVDGTRVHKSTTTSLIEQASKAMNDLTKGTFFKLRHIDPDFAKRNKIPSEWLKNGKKFTQAEIIRCIPKYALYLKEGYWPTNKAHLPKDLSTFFYNPKNASSFFLIVLCNDNLKPLIEKHKNSDRNPAYTKPFKHFGILDDIREEQLLLVYRGIASIERRVLNEWVFNFNESYTRRMLGERKSGKLELMFNEYAEFVYNEYNDWTMEDVFSPYGKHFKDFVQTFNNEG